MGWAGGMAGRVGREGWPGGMARRDGRDVGLEGFTIEHSLLSKNKAGQRRVLQLVLDIYIEQFERIMVHS